MAVLLTPIFGTTYIPSDMFKSISAYFIVWGWGNKNGPTQNTNFFTPLWYQNHWATINSILFVTPFIPIIMGTLVYLFIKCGICYEIKTRIKSCSDGCCASMSKDKPKKQPYDIFEKTVYYVGTLVFIFAIGFGRVDFFLFGLISFGAQYFIDSFAITYLYKTTLIMGDPTGIITKIVLALASCLFLILGYYVFQYNQCAVSTTLN